MYGTSFAKRLMAGLMILVMAFMVPSVHVQGAGKKTYYVKSFRLFIKEGGSFDDAVKWASEQGSSWHAVEGDLNAGAEALVKKKIGVFLCYETTFERSEAVTDIAVMNEKGSYSEGSYKRMVTEHRKLYSDLVQDMKKMIDEYRVNVRNSIPTALQAKKAMNAYIDPDSGKRLGDLIMEIDDDRLTEILLQANGMVVMMVQEQVSYASDTATRTWLDRMVQLGNSGNAYNSLFKRAKLGFNGDEQKAEKALDEKYKTDALMLKGKFEGIRTHLEAVIRYAAENGLDKMNSNDKKAWLDKHSDEPRAQVYMIESAVSSALATYKYEATNLLDFFLQKEGDFEGDRIKRLYPMVSALSDGQIASLRQTTDLFTLVNAAIRASAENGYSKGVSAKLDEEDKAEVKANTDKYEAALDGMVKAEEPISIYEGVDRDIYGDGGIAVTTNVEGYKTDDNGTWADALFGDDDQQKLMLAAGVGTVSCALMAGLFAHMISHVNSTATEAGWEYAKDLAEERIEENIAKSGMSKTAIDKASTHSYEDIIEISKMTKKQIRETGLLSRTKDQMQQSLTEYRNHGMNVGHNALKIKLFTGLKWGLTIAALILAGYEIVETVHHLYEYYHTEHLPIPHHMIDITYNMSRRTGFVNYKSVKDQNGENGDLNGDGGKQWLALYETHDARAGDPVLAPENGRADRIIVQTGSDKLPSDKYSPLHMFGTPLVSQNLTYEDGMSGYSYNDKNGGTYLFFRRDDDSSSVTDDKGTTDTGAASTSGSPGADAKETTDTGDTSGEGDGEAGTTVSGGYIAIAAVAGLAAGIFIGVIGMNFKSRKKHYENKNN
ncbi:MAG: hypothetical protein J6P16_01190 [Eubacterium sp.]|nr:hypothetical protein [Eubacterium sp.]